MVGDADLVIGHAVGLLGDYRAPGMRSFAGVVIIGKRQVVTGWILGSAIESLGIFNTAGLPQVRQLQGLEGSAETGHVVVISHIRNPGFEVLRVVGFPGGSPAVVLRGHSVIGLVGIGSQALTDGDQVSKAIQPIRRLPCRSQRGYEQYGQHRHDRDDHQQFDERKCRFVNGSGFPNCW